MAQERRPTLASIAPMVMNDGHRRVKPWDCFMAEAQTTSNTPAMMRMSHATTASRIGRRAVPDFDPLLGRTWPRKRQIGRAQRAVNPSKKAARVGRPFRVIGA